MGCFWAKSLRHCDCFVQLHKYIHLIASCVSQCALSVIKDGTFLTTQSTSQLLCTWPALCCVLLWLDSRRLPKSFRVAWLARGNITPTPSTMKQIIGQSHTKALKQYKTNPNVNIMGYTVSILSQSRAFVCWMFNTLKECFFRIS